MDNSIREKVYVRYVDDTTNRLYRLSKYIAAGEFCIMFLDFQSKFFENDPLNYLNLVAEILIIFGALAFYTFCKRIEDKAEIDSNQKVKAIVLFRIVIMLSIMIFIFTDIYVRKSPIGAYMVFLFVLQVTPAYNRKTNWIQLAVIGFVTAIEYILFVSSDMNVLFSTLVIFICFAITSEYIRSFFIQHLENFYLAEDSNLRFRKLSRHTIASLAGAVEAKDKYTKGHSQRVADYSSAIAEKMGYTEQQIKEVSFIALMHDIGKIGVPDSVITKEDTLTYEEYEEIKKHPSIGYEILKDIKELPGISEGARWHHERYDGKGYPDGLKGTDIPEIARIIAVADAYDAMTSNRSYRKALPQEFVRNQIEMNSGTQFDPKMASIMVELIDADTDYLMHE